MVGSSGSPRSGLSAPQHFGARKPHVCCPRGIRHPLTNISLNSQESRPVATNSGVSGSKPASSMASRYISHTTWAPWQGHNHGGETACCEWRFGVSGDSARQPAWGWHPVAPAPHPLTSRPPRMRNHSAASFSTRRCAPAAGMRQG